MEVYLGDRLRKTKQKFNNFAERQKVCLPLDFKNLNKSGPAQVGAISKAQKWQKDFTVFSSKVHEKPKKLDRIGALKGGNLSHFLTSIVAKYQKIEGEIEGLFEEHFFRKKSHNAKKTERGPFSLSRYCMLREKRGKILLVQFARPNDAIWDHKIS